jgi:hypothetical protein
MPDWEAVYERLRACIESFGVAVVGKRLGLETTGVFDGLSITTNTAYDLETRCHNIAHAFGHIVQWSLDYPRFQRLYEGLYAAKANKEADREGLQRALADFRRYEEEASGYATWLLGHTGHADAIPAFTNFARADIEAIVAFHRDGTAPAWHTFFADWNAQVARGERHLRGFEPKPVPPFTPVGMTPQEVIQNPEP